MGNKHAAGRPPVGGSFATTILALARRTKRLIMTTAHAVAIPVAPSAVGARRTVERSAVPRQAGWSTRSNVSRG